MQVLVPPMSVAVQRIELAPDFSVGSGGFDVSVNPLTDDTGTLLCRRIPLMS